MRSDKSYRQIHFRYNLANNLLRLIKAGESAAVVGLAGVGKSEFCKYLQQIEIGEIYSGQAEILPLIMAVDSNNLRSIREWDFFEYLIYCLYNHCQKVALPEQITLQVEQIHEKLWNQRDATRAQRYFEQVVNLLCQTNKLKLVFLFDQFDILFEELPARLFINLRATRDKSEGRLVYVPFLRKSLGKLRSDVSKVEPFIELFQNNTFGLPPYDLQATEDMLFYLSESQQTRWLEKYTNKVFNLSGGHAGVIKAIFMKISPKLEVGNSLILNESIFSGSGVVDECQKIWNYLSKDEKSFVQNFIQTDQPEQILTQISTTILKKIEQKGMITYLDNQRPHLFSKLFAHFVQQNILKLNSGISFEFDENSRTCWIDDHEIMLSPLPSKLLGFLYKNRGKTCNQLDLLQCLYPDEDHSQTGNIPDYRLPAIVKNLREKIEVNPHKQYLKTVRSIGFKLEID